MRAWQDAGAECAAVDPRARAWRGGSGAETELPGAPRAVPHSVLRLLQPVFILFMLSHCGR